MTLVVLFHIPFTNPSPQVSPPPTGPAIVTQDTPYTTTLAGIATQISVDHGRACALSDGTIYCWGADKETAPNDNSLGFQSEEPTPVKGLPGRATAVTVGGGHICALTANEAAYCWGNNSHGQIGDGTKGEPGNSEAQTSANRELPVLVTEIPSKITAITAGQNHTCAITKEGKTYCWGANEHYQLGNGESQTGPPENNPSYGTDSAVPVPVQGLPSPAIDIKAGKWQTCAVVENGTTYCWGALKYALPETEAGTTFATAQALTNLPDNVTQVSTDKLRYCALTKEGEVYCLGLYAENEEWFKKRGENNNYHYPTRVPDLPDKATSVSVGQDHSCALIVDGTVYCWGINSTLGQLGDGTTEHRPGPVKVQGIPGKALSLSTNSWTSCVTTDTKQVYCWGNRIR